MQKSKPTATLMECQINIELLKGEEFTSTLHRKAIGSLMYLMLCAIADLAFAAGCLSQHMEHPTRDLWVCVKRIFRTNGTADSRLVFDRSGSDLNNRGYVDADWSGCRLDRESASGSVIIFAGAAVLWKSKKPIVNALSAEAEYVALGAAPQEWTSIGRMVSFATGSENQSTIPVKVEKQAGIKCLRTMQVETGKNKLTFVII